MLLTMSRCRRYVCGYFFTVAASLLPASIHAEQLTLEDAVANTLKYNPQLFQYGLIQESLTATRETSALSPAIQLELELENIANTGAENFSDGSEFTLALSSVIELGGAKRARISFAEANLSLNKAQLQAETLDVLGGLTTTFIEGLTSQALLDLAREEHELAQSSLNSVQARAQRGAASEAEVLRAKAALIKADIRAQTLSKKLDRTLVELAAFWGESSPQFTELRGDIFVVGKHYDFDSLYARASASPAMQVFANQGRLKNAELQLARANSRVDLSWRFGVQQFEESGESALTASLSLPLFSGSRNAGNIRAATAERELVDARQQSALVQLRTQLFNAHSRYTQNIATAEAIHNTLLPTLEQAFTQTRLAYERGRDRYENLLSAQEQLLNAKQLHIEAASAALKNQALIEQLTGQALTQ